jgi:hypothetical protein
MAFYPIESILGLKGFTNIDTTTALPFGTIVRGVDSASGKGGGEFIYLPGVAATEVGSLVVYNPIAKTTTKTPNTANLAQPLAVAMAAVTTTGNFGWYQISGVAVIKKTAVAVNPNVAIFLSATIGRVMSTVGTGKEVLNARSVNATTIAAGTSTVNVLINRPFAQGQII